MSSFVACALPFGKYRCKVGFQLTCGIDMAMPVCQF